MKISELLTILQDMQAKHGDLQVQCTWETIYREIGSIYRDDITMDMWVEVDGRREYRVADVVALVIDADRSWPPPDVPEDLIGYKLPEGA